MTLQIKKLRGFLLTIIIALGFLLPLQTALAIEPGASFDPASRAMLANGATGSVKFTLASLMVFGKDSSRVIMFFIRSVVMGV